MKFAIIAIAIAFAFVIGNILFLLHMGKKPMLKPEDAAKVKKPSADDRLHTDRETTNTLVVVNTQHDTDTDQISQRGRLSIHTNMDHAQGKEQPNAHDQQQSAQSSDQSSGQSTDTSSASSD